MTFSRLEDDLTRARMALQDAHDRLYCAKVAALRVSLGDIVKGRRGEDMLVRKIGRLGDEPTLHGSVRLLGGGWAAKVRRIYVRPDKVEIVGREDHDYERAGSLRDPPGDMRQPELSRDPHRPHGARRQADS